MLGNARNNLAKCMKILKQLHLRKAVEPEISVKLSLNLRFCSLMAISSQLGGSKSPAYAFGAHPQALPVPDEPGSQLGQ